MIAWVWDVYDANQQRALRLSGEEPAGKAGRDAWAAADDMVLRKIAQAGLSGLSSMINGGPAEVPPAAPAPSRRGPAVASAEPGARRPWLQRRITRKFPSLLPILAGKTGVAGCRTVMRLISPRPSKTRRFCRYLRC